MKKIFTLEGLLIVIAIVCISVGLLLPSIRATCGATHNTEYTFARMRQVGLGIQLYSTVFDDVVYENPDDCMFPGDPFAPFFPWEP